MIRKALLLGLSCLLGCEATPAPAPDPIEEEEMMEVQTKTSYLRDVQPIVERSCLSCHSTGGIAPMAFEDPQVVKMWAPAIENAVRSGRMPPFYASTDCQNYQHDPRLSEAETALLSEWVAEGAPIGDLAEAKHAEPIAPPVVRADRVLDIGGDFDATIMGYTDNYRCFTMDPGAATNMMVTGYEVIPGNRALVHHVLAYLVAPDDADQLETNDARDEGLGYTCMSGGVGIQGAIGNQIAGWVPGGQATRLPEGTGLEVEAGSRIVIQIHYNLLALSSGASPIDRTQLILETAPAGTLEVANVIPMLKRNLMIDAGDPNSVQTFEVALPMAAGATIYRLTGHMHMLGKQVKLEAIHANGDSTCLLDIPSWDFNWQREYSLMTPFVLSAGDKLRITCVYDNSATNQPVVDGMQQQPRDVVWGESSLDEMCMTYMTFTR